MHSSKPIFLPSSRQKRPRQGETQNPSSHSSSHDTHKRTKFLNKNRQNGLQNDSQEDNSSHTPHTHPGSSFKVGDIFDQFLDNSLQFQQKLRTIPKDPLSPIISAIASRLAVSIWRKVHIQFPETHVAAGEWENQVKQSEIPISAETGKPDIDLPSPDVIPDSSNPFCYLTNSFLDSLAESAAQQISPNSSSPLVNLFLKAKAAQSKSSNEKEETEKVEKNATAGQNSSTPSTPSPPSQFAPTVAASKPVTGQKPNISPTHALEISHTKKKAKKRPLVTIDLENGSTSPQQPIQPPAKKVRKNPESVKKPSPVSYRESTSSKATDSFETPRFKIDKERLTDNALFSNFIVSNPDNLSSILELVSTCAASAATLSIWTLLHHIMFPKKQKVANLRLGANESSDDSVTANLHVAMTHTNRILFKLQKLLLNQSSLGTLQYHEKTPIPIHKANHEVLTHALLYASSVIRSQNPNNFFKGFSKIQQSSRNVLGSATSGEANPTSGTVSTNHKVSMQYMLTQQQHQHQQASSTNNQRKNIPKPVFSSQQHQTQTTTSASRNQSCDLTDGHLDVKPGMHLGHPPRYTVASLIGEGTFGKVVDAVDRTLNKNFAIKIIRNIPKYRHAAKNEIEVLQRLRHFDPQGVHHCIQLDRFFEHRNHICMSFPKYGLSLYDFMKQNNYHPYSLTQLRVFIRQLLDGVAYMHRHSLIHTDLKPENILFLDSSYDIRPSQTCPEGKKVPKKLDIKVIDFGSTADGFRVHKSIVTTRHYRAPEVILGLGWSYPADVWSLACIMVELYCGEAIFQTHDNVEHLAMMEQVLGPLPYEGFIGRVTDPERQWFTSHGRLLYPQLAPDRDSIRHVTTLKPLRNIIFPKHYQFYDLLKKMFVYYPANRITAEEALKHPFLQET